MGFHLLEVFFCDLLCVPVLGVLRYRDFWAFRILVIQLIEFVMCSGF